MERGSHQSKCQVRTGYLPGPSGWPHRSLSLHNDGWHSLSGAGLRTARTRPTSGRFSLDAGFPWRFQSAAQLCSLVDSIPGSVCVVRWEGCLKWEPGIQSVALSGWAVGHSCLRAFRKHTCARIFTCARAAQAWCLAQLCDVAGAREPGLSLSSQESVRFVRQRVKNSSLQVKPAVSIALSQRTYLASVQSRWATGHRKATC